MTSSTITRSGNQYVLLGDLSLHGVTKELALKATFGGKAKDPRGRERAVFGATTAIDREAFGLKWNQILEAGWVAVGSTADLQIEVEALKA